MIEPERLQRTLSPQAQALMAIYEARGKAFSHLAAQETTEVSKEGSGFFSGSG